MPYIPKQYDSATAFSKVYTNLGNIIDKEDNARLKAYSLYDDFYYNRPETFRVTRRGESDIEIYLPSTKMIVNATARFLAVDFDYTLKGGQRDVLQQLITDIFARETVQAKHIKGKKSMLSRGDMAWYITGDPSKPKGEKLSINTIHPSSVFRIEDKDNAFRVIGYHLVDIIKDPRPRQKPSEPKLLARRQTFRKKGGRITTECLAFEIGKWDDRHLSSTDLKPVLKFWDEMPLPEQITSLPVYMIQNNEPDGSTWGISQVAGIEYLINAMNQSITYEDLSLVLQGLGVYVTTAAPPVDKATGKEGKYKMHPGNVVQMSQGDTFDKVTGVATVAPFQDHLSSMKEWATDGLPDMATGNVDVAVAQSGIALALKMGPVLAENSDKQQVIQDRWNQMGYDLIHMWIPAFEGLESLDTEWNTTFGDPMPIDRTAFIEETVALFTADLITFEEVRERLEKVGYSKLSNAEKVLLEQAAKKSDAGGGTAMLNENGATSKDLASTFKNPKLELVT